MKPERKTINEFIDKSKTILKYLFCGVFIILLITFTLLPDPTIEYVQPTLLWEACHFTYVLFLTSASIPIWIALIGTVYNQYRNSTNNQRKTKTDRIKELEKIERDLQMQLSVEKSKHIIGNVEDGLLKITIGVVKNNLCPDCSDKLKNHIEYIKNLESAV